jgi:hypothetical protein
MSLKGSESHFVAITLGLMEQIPSSLKQVVKWISGNAENQYYSEDHNVRGDDLTVLAHLREKIHQIRKWGGPSALSHTSESDRGLIPERFSTHRCTLNVGFVPMVDISLLSLEER